MHSREFALMCIAAGYTATYGFVVWAAYALFSLFGCGWLAATLVTTYLVWATVYQWETINEQVAVILEDSGL